MSISIVDALPSSQDVIPARTSSMRSGQPSGFADIFAEVGRTVAPRETSQPESRSVRDDAIVADDDASGTEETQSDAGTEAAIQAASASPAQTAPQSTVKTDGVTRSGETSENVAVETATAQKPASTVTAPAVLAAWDMIEVITSDPAEEVPVQTTVEKPSNVSGVSQNIAEQLQKAVARILQESQPVSQPSTPQTVPSTSGDVDETVSIANNQASPSAGVIPAGDGSKPVVNAEMAWVRSLDAALRDSLATASAEQGKEQSQSQDGKAAVGAPAKTAQNEALIASLQSGRTGNATEVAALIPAQVVEASVKAVSATGTGEAPVTMATEKVAPEVRDSGVAVAAETPQSGKTETPQAVTGVEGAKIASMQNTHRAPAAAESTANPAPQISVRDMGDFVVRQVRFSSAEGGGEHTFTVQLVPKSLGHVQLEVTTGQQGVSVHLITANPAAKEALEGQMSVLRDTLNKNGYEVNRLQVTSGQPGTSQFSFNQSAADSRTQNDGAPRLISGYPGAAASAADTSGAAAKVARPNWHSGQLNVFV